MNPYLVLQRRQVACLLLDETRRRIEQIPVSRLDNHHMAVSVRLLDLTVAAVSQLAESILLATSDPQVSDVCGQLARIHVNQAAALVQHEHSEHASVFSVNAEAEDHAPYLCELRNMMSQREQGYGDG